MSVTLFILFFHLNDEEREMAFNDNETRQWVTIVEDNDNIQCHIRDMLRMMGHTCLSHSIKDLCFVPNTIVWCGTNPCYEKRIPAILFHRVLQQSGHCCHSYADVAEPSDSSPSVTVNWCGHTPCTHAVPVALQEFITKRRAEEEERLCVTQEAILGVIDWTPITERKRSTQMEDSMEMGTTKYKKLFRTLNCSLDLVSEGPAKLLPHLYLGSFAHTQSSTFTQNAGITHVIYCCWKECVSQAAVPLLSNDHPQPNAMYLDTKDDSEYDMLGQHYADVKTFLDNVKKSGGRCLLSCNQGINRSGILAIAYVTDECYTDPYTDFYRINHPEYVPTLLEAATHVVSQRGQACINRDFQRKLVAFATQRGWRIEE